MGGVISTVINIGFYSSILTVGLTAAFLALTKPRTSNLDHILNDMLDTPTSVSQKLTQAAASKIMSYTLDYTVKDYVFFKIVHIKLPGGRTETIYGAVNKWVRTPHDFFTPAHPASQKKH